MVLIKCVAGGGCVANGYLYFFCCLFMVSVSNTDLASTSYVQKGLDTKLDINSGVQQQLAGDYVVTGILKVPTQLLPEVQ